MGLGAYLGLMIVVAAAGIRLWRRRMPGGDWLLIGLTATFIAAATEELWLDPATAFLTALVWGAVLALGAGKRAYE